MESIPGDTTVVPFSRVMGIAGFILVALGLWVGISKGLVPLLDLKEKAGYSSILEGPPVVTTISGIVKAIGGDSDNVEARELSAEGVMSVIHRLGLYAGMGLAGLGILACFEPAGAESGKRSKIQSRKQRSRP